MHYNILGYWQHLENLPARHKDRPSPRVCRLMTGMFEGWRTRQPFPETGCFGHLRDRPGVNWNALKDQSVTLRRGHAMSETLAMIVGDWGKRAGFFKIDPDELIVGTMPPFSVGQGKEVMDYLKGPNDDHDERLAFEVGFLNPWSNFGHICPDHELVVTKGLDAIIVDCRARGAKASAERKPFYRSIEIALKGVIAYAESYAEEASRLAEMHHNILRVRSDHPQRMLFEQRIAGMNAAAERLRRIPAAPCKTFTDAVQCIFLMNSVLHWTGELTSIGRLDQVLNPFLEKDDLNDDTAQEIIDCLWVKLDERVTLDNRHLHDHFTSADGALMGAGGPSNFDQGALANQWMQQVTIGGVVADDDPTPRDACNRVTRLCLHAARRLPLNCPTLDLRVHTRTPDDVLELAADALLSGGAHPILMNDDRIVPALHTAGPNIPLRTARNYACDGCYETVFPGETEFSFFYVPGIDVLEKALNSGAGFGAAGSVHMRGMKASFRTADASEIDSFEALYAIIEEHIALGAHRGLAGLFGAYGAKGQVCPSPILSAMIQGCVEKGRDFYDGGARHHVFAPLMTGISTVADSLAVIKHLIFEQKKFSLVELVSCLRSDWGGRDISIGHRLTKARIKEIRNLCLAEPKFGQGNRIVDELAWRFINSFVDAVEVALKHPLHKPALQRLDERFGRSAEPFVMVITPGVGTFEQYSFGGFFAGATPDGRKSGQPIASDLAASPVPQDLPPLADGQLEHLRRYPLKASMASWRNPSIDRLSDGAPADINIREDFPRVELVDVLRAFARGDGSNVMTVTVANPETMQAAEERPDQYDLLRVRMGGWTEFFSVLFGPHKQQHRRRPLYVPTKESTI